MKWRFTAFLGLALIGAWWLSTNGSDRSEPPKPREVQANKVTRRITGKSRIDPVFTSEFLESTEEKAERKATFKRSKGIKRGNMALQGHWRFHGNTNDETVNAQHGTLIGGATIGASAVSAPDGGGNVLKLDGINDLFRLPQPAVDITGSALTVAFWLRPTSSSNQIPVVKRANGDGTDQYYVGFEDIGGALYWFGKNGGNAPGGASYTNDQLWHHFAVTYDGTTARFYKDGVLATTSTGVSGAITSVASATTEFGYHSGFNANAEMASMRIYNEVLTAPDLLAIKTAEAPGAAGSVNSSMFMGF